MLLTGLIAGFLIGGCNMQKSQTDGGQTSLAVTLQKTEDQASVNIADSAAVITVTSESGIGKITIDPAGAPPKKLLLRLHLGGLEELTLARGDTLVRGGITHRDGQHPSPLLSGRYHANQRWKRLGPSDPEYADIKIFSESDKSAVPLKDGYFQVEVPKMFYADGAAFEVRWIDFYR